MSQIKQLNKTYDVKIILLGEGGVGKTSLINVYLDKRFNLSEKPTSEGYLSLKKIKINNKELNINLWDTVGQERFRSVTKKFIRGSNIIIFVFDITNRASFLELKFWVNNVYQELAKEEVIFGVIGNKIDLFDKSEIETTEAEEYAKKIGALFIEASAKKSPEDFKNFINILLNKLVETPHIIEKLAKVEGESNIQLKESPKGKKKCCK